MGFNFPNAPAVNDVYPVSPGPGIPQYRWDGTKWISTTTSATIDGGVVRYDTAQALNAAQQTQARANILAPSMDAMAANGMQLNGNVEVSQERGIAAFGPITSTSWNGYYADMWKLAGANAANTASWSGGTRAPSGGLTSSPAVLFYQAANALAAQAGLANGDTWLFRTYVEGYRIQRLQWGTANAQPLFYGFRFYCTVPGTLLTKWFNFAGTRFYYREHAVIAGWNWVTGTIPGDTAGAWTTLGLDIIVVGKTAAPVAPNAWTATNAQQSTGSTNFLAANGNAVEVTGLILLPGLYGPDSLVAPNIMRPWDVELPYCQRYYEKSYDDAALPGAVDDHGMAWLGTYYTVNGVYSFLNTVFFKVRKRQWPTMTGRSNASGSAGYCRDRYNSADVAVSFNNVGHFGFTWSASMSASAPTCNMTMQWTADARI